MSLAQGNNTPTRPRIEPGSPDPESDAQATRPVRPPPPHFFLWTCTRHRFEVWNLLYRSFILKVSAFTNKCHFIYDPYEYRCFIDGINPVYTNKPIKDREKNTISPLRLHAASSVRIPKSTHSFLSLLPTVRIRPLKLFSVSSVNLCGTYDFSIFCNNPCVRLSPI